MASTAGGGEKWERSCATYRRLATTLHKDVRPELLAGHLPLCGLLNIRAALGWNPTTGPPVGDHGLSAIQQARQTRDAANKLNCPLKTVHVARITYRDYFVNTLRVSSGCGARPLSRNEIVRAAAILENFSQAHSRAARPCLRIQWPEPNRELRERR